MFVSNETGREIVIFDTRFHLFYKQSDPTSVFYIYTHSPQVALRIIVPKIRSEEEKVAMLGLAVSRPHHLCGCYDVFGCVHRYWRLASRTADRSSIKSWESSNS